MHILVFWTLEEVVQLVPNKGWDSEGRGTFISVRKAFGTLPASVHTINSLFNVLSIYWICLHAS